jgi:hypothetical protein
MTSQNNNAKLSLNRISNYILAEQFGDIRAYTLGHLNENHLFKPPEEKTHKPWTGASIKNNANSKSLVNFSSKKLIFFFLNKNHILI